MKWYFQIMVILSVLFHGRVNFQWYFSDIAIFQYYETNFSFYEYESYLHEYI